MRGAVAKDGKLNIGDVDEPVPEPFEAIVRNHASSINQGEVRGIRTAPHWKMSKADGVWIPGWDFAGTIERAAGNGSGPAVGARVVGWVRQGAWAERVAAPVDQLVEIPDQVSFKEAATLPIAGLTAWHALRVGELAAGKRVLVVGATGGVGRFALQIARSEGANVAAVVSSQARVETVADLADEVFVGMPAEGAFDVILECIGGSALATALAVVAPYGTIVSYGNSSGEETCFEAGPLFRKPCLRLQSFSLHDELARRSSMSEGLDQLVALLADGKLRMDIDLEVGLEDAGAACDALMARKVNGKAVILFA